MNPQEMIAFLRDEANKMEKSIKIEPVIEDMTLQEAAEKLVGLDSASIQLNLNHYSHTQGWTCQWSVWDGSKHHEKATLRKSVESALARANPEPADTTITDFAPLEKQLAIATVDDLTGDPFKVAG